MTNDAGARVGASRPSRATEADAEPAEGVATGDGDPDGRWRVCTAADVPAEPVRWLWKDHFALGKISVVAGSANVGKTLMVAGDFASRVSCGTAWPGGSACPAGDVVIVGRHDGLTDTLVPRLKDHGADLRRVHFVGGVVYDNDTDPSYSELGLLGALEEALRSRPGVKLVVVDPVADFLEARRPGRRTDMLTALGQLADRYGAAFVLVADLAERSGKWPLAGIGPALVAAARSVWVVSRDGDEPGRRLFLPAKNNLGAECSGHAWRPADGKVQWEPKPLPAGGEESLGQRAKRLAAAFIADFLKDGPRMWLVIEHNAKLAGHKAWALGCVRGKVAEPFKTKGKDGRWLWRLVGDERDWCQLDYEDVFGGDPVGRRAAGNALDRLGIGAHVGLSLRNSGLGFDPDEAEDDDDADDQNEEDDDDEEA